VTTEPGNSPGGCRAPHLWNRLACQAGVLLRARRDTYADKSAFDPIERAQGARLFVLDDAGLSGGGKDELPMLHEILDTGTANGSRLSSPAICHLIIWPAF